MVKDQNIGRRRTTLERSGCRAKTLGAAQQAAWNTYWSKGRSARHLWSVSSEVVRYFGAATPLRSIDSDRVDELVTALETARNSAATINRKLAALSRMFTVARERRWIDERDRPVMKRRREENWRQYVVSHDEEDLIVSTYHRWGMTDMADLVVVLIDTGARPWQEIPLGLAWPAINFKAKTLTICGRKSPTGSIVNTTLPMTPRVAEIMKHRREAGYEKPFACFTTYRRMNVQWEKLRAYVGKTDDPGFTLYAFRHTCGARLAEAGHTLIEIASWLGHARTSTTERYARHMTTNSLARLAHSLAKQTDEHRRSTRLVHQLRRALGHLGGRVSQLVKSARFIGSGRRRYRCALAESLGGTSPRTRDER